MSTRTRTVRCSQCGQTGHNRRTCDAHAEINREIHSAIVMCSGLAKKCEKVISKKVEKKPEPKKHNCTICMCDIETEKDSMCLPCGHHFHVTCGLKWLQENNSCPCCRAECGEKPKKLPVLNNEVAAALTGELLSSSNVVLDISQRNQAICEQPWTYPDYNRYLNERESPYSRENDRDYTQEELKEHWNNEAQATQIRLKCRFLYQNNAQSLGMLMMDGFSSARTYQEGDFDLSAVLVNQPESGLIIQLPFAPTQAEREVENEDTESDIEDMPVLVWHDDDADSDDEDSDETLLSEATTVNVDGELDIAVSDILGDEATLILDGPMTMEELETPLTAQNILDQHYQGGEYNAGGDEDITEEEALEIIEVLTTPEPAPIQVPNAPRRPRRTNRSAAQSPPPSPRTVADQHVTRRSSERIRQRYRRRRLQEEQDYSLTM